MSNMYGPASVDIRHGEATHPGPNFQPHRYTKLPHLKHLSISFGDNIVKRSSVMVTMNMIGVTVNGQAIIDTDLFTNESDPEEDGENKPADDEMAFCMGQDRMPMLKHLVVHCSKDPMATVKMISFLNSLIRVRKGMPNKLETIKIRATYMPTKLTNPKSEFRRQLEEITDTFHESHGRPYLPGRPVGAAMGGGDHMFGTGWV